MDNPYMTPALARAARALLGWTRGEMAERARVSLVTIRDYENGTRVPHRVTRDALAKTILDAGIEFTGGEKALPGLVVHDPELLHSESRFRQGKSAG